MIKKRILILDIPIDSISFDDTKRKIHRVIQKRAKLFAATVNASFIYKSQTEPSFKKILITSDLNLPDGVSIQLAAEYLNTLPRLPKLIKPLIYLVRGFYIGVVRFLFLNKKFTVIKERITGVDLTKYILQLSNSCGYKICILHRKDSILSIDSLSKYLKKNFPKLKFSIVPVSNNSTSDDIGTISSDIYLCSLGEFNQEKLLKSLYIKNKRGVYVGIGSTFDVLSSKIINVNDKYKQRGLEWLVRLITRPKRIFKILRSVLLFPWKVYLTSL